MLDEAVSVWAQLLYVNTLASYGFLLPISAWNVELPIFLLRYPADISLQYVCWLDVIQKCNTKCYRGMENDVCMLYAHIWLGAVFISVSIKGTCYICCSGVINANSLYRSDVMWYWSLAITRSIYAGEKGIPTIVCYVGISFVHVRYKTTAALYRYEAISSEMQNWKRTRISDCKQRHITCMTK